MTLQLGMVTIDCADPHKLAAFWTRALDVEIAEDYGDYLFLTAPEGGSVVLGMQRVPERLSGKNRLHLDFGTTERTSEVRRLVRLGATEGETHTVPGLTWTVLSDPEGNQFCVGNYH